MSAKSLILESAKQQFAEKGFDGVSLRELSRIAGVNSASVHYHFNGKEDIYKTLISDYLSQLNELRQQKLQQIDFNSSRSTIIEKIIKGYISGHIALCRNTRDHYYVKLLARMVLEENPAIAEFYLDELKDVRAAYFLAIQESCPALSEQIIQRAFSTMVTLMIFLPFDNVHRHIATQGQSPANEEAMIDHIVSVTSSLLQASFNDT